MYPRVATIQYERDRRGVVELCSWRQIRISSVVLKRRANLPKTANPEMKEYNESDTAIIIAFLKAGSSRRQCEPYAVIIPNVMLREKKT